MKLHLPKGLFVAVMATMTLVPAAWGGTAYHSGSDAYLFGGTNDGLGGMNTSTLTQGFKVSGNFVEVPVIDSTGMGDFKIWCDANEGLVADVQIGEWKIDDNAHLNIGKSDWNANKYLDTLHIQKLNIGEGTASIEISKSEHKVRIDSVIGSLGTVNNIGTLTLGAATVGNVTNNGTFNITGTITGATEDAAISGPVNVVVDNKSTTIMNYEGITYRNADGTAASGNSGFVTGKQTLTIFKGISQTSGAFTINGQEATLEDNGTYTYNAGTETSLFIVDDSWTYNAEQSEGADKYYVSAKGTLNFTTAGEHTLPSVSGLGNLQVSSTDSEVQLTVTSISDFTGGITVTKGTAAAILNLSGINDTLGAKSIALEGGTLSLDVAQGTTTTYANSITGDGQLTKTGAGTLKLTGNTPFTGTIDVQAGEVRADGKKITFNVGTVIVRNGGKFTTHFQDSDNFSTVIANIDLVSGSTLYNDDGHVKYTGTIRANIVDPTASKAEYNANGEVTITPYWGKHLYLAGLLEGSGTINLHNTQFANNPNQNWDYDVWYHLQNENNTFNGTYKLIGNGIGETEKDVINLHIEKQNAAQYASVNLASTVAVSKLILNTSASIVGLDGSDADNIVTTNTESATLSVQQGSFGGKLQDNGNAALALTKDGAGTLTLSGANTYTGGTTIKKGILALSGNGTLGSGLVTIEKDGTLKTNGSAATMTVTGAGAIDLGSSATLNATLDSTWTGTVKMTGTTLSGTNLNDYGNGQSTLELCGTHGTLASGSVLTNIKLVNTDSTTDMPGIKITTTTGNEHSVTFAGSVSGSGNFVVEPGAGQNGGIDTYEFTGNVSGWTGNFISTVDVNLVYGGNSTEINNGIASNKGKMDVTIGGSQAVQVNGKVSDVFFGPQWSNGTLNLSVLNSSEDGVSFTKEVEANSIAVGSNSKATFNSKAEAATLTVGEGASAKFTNADVKLTDVTMEKGASLAITAAKTLMFQNLTLADGTTINPKAAATLVDAAEATTNVSITVSKKASFGEGATIYADLTLANGATVEMAEELTLGGTLTLGTGLTLGGELYTAITSMTKDTEAIVLFTGVTELLGVDALTRSGEINFSTYFTNVTSETGTYELYYNEGTVSVAFTATPVVDPDGGETDIPEPTTGALSLIGLAALAMRRRRRA